MTISYNDNPLFNAIVEQAARIESAEVIGGNLTWDDLPADAQRSWLEETRVQLAPAFYMFAGSVSNTLNLTVEATLAQNKRVKAQALANNLSATFDQMFKPDAPKRSEGDGSAEIAAG